ncbi:3-isopropylmalate/(R)-2-methylmalate dehydratase large subunit, partial [Candidatus Hakubella thermalkaliphila]
IPVPAGH